MLVHFEMKSEESNDSSVRVGGAPCHEVKKEIISISSGSDPESSSEISSRAARVPKTRERVCSKRKQRGTSFLCSLFLNFLIFYASRE